MKQSRCGEIDDPDQLRLLLDPPTTDGEEPGARSWRASHHLETPEPPELEPPAGPHRPAA